MSWRDKPTEDCEMCQVLYRDDGAPLGCVLRLLWRQLDLRLRTVASGSKQSRNMPFGEFWKLLGGRSDKLPQQPDIGYRNARNRSYSEECWVKGAVL
jgi:hypothetical protein